jgi:hypothetical protein
MRWFHTNPEYLAGVRNALVRGAGIHLTQCVAHARVTPAKFLGFFFGADWLARYLWLDTLGGANERICVTERGKFTIAQRSTRVDRGEGSSEFWALN